MKKMLSLLIAVLLALSFCACGSSAQKDDPNATRMFTDSLGREVEVPAVIDRVAVTGPISQTFVYALCPEKLVGLSVDWDPSAAEFIPEEYFGLTKIGQIYGTGGEFNPEALLSTGAQVVIDIGEPKKGEAEDLDALAEQTGIPFVHITAYVDSMDDAFRMLGELLGIEDTAEQYAKYCDDIYTRAYDIAQKIEKKDVLYILGEGRNVLPNGSFHAEILEFFCNNLAVVESPSGKGSGNEVDMEQILNWDPEYILFAPNTVYDLVGTDPLWQGLQAIRNNRYYEVPFGPYNWLGLPPGAQRLLGLMWLPSLLYPEECSYDLRAEVKAYYEMFYHTQITDEQIDRLLANSTGKDK